MEETPKTLIEGFIQTAQTHHTAAPKRWRQALTRTPDKFLPPSPGVSTRSATKLQASPEISTRSATKWKRSDLPEKTPRTMIESYMTNAKTELLSTARTRRRRSFPTAPLNVTAENFTPRTNIAMLMEKGEEEMPYVRPQTRRSSNKSLPSLPISDTIELLPMSPSEGEPSVMNSTRRRSLRRSTADLTPANTTADSARKRKRRSSTWSLTNQTLDGVDEAIHLLPDSSSGDEALENDDDRKKSPMRNSKRSKFPSSSQMFNLKEVLTTETEQEGDNINTDDNLSENVHPPSSPEKETSSKSSPLRIPETQEIGNSIDHRIGSSFVHIPETQEDSTAGESEPLESSPRRPFVSSQSEDGADADNEDEDDEGSHSTSTDKDINNRAWRSSLTGNQTLGDGVGEKDQASTESDVTERGRARSILRDQSSSEKDLGEKVLRRSLRQDQTLSEDSVFEKDQRKSLPSEMAVSHGNVSTNAVDVAGLDRNQQRKSVPEIISTVIHHDNTENSQSNSIFDKSTSLVEMEDDTNIRGSTDKDVVHASSVDEDIDPSNAAAEDRDLPSPSNAAEDRDLPSPSNAAGGRDLAGRSNADKDMQGIDEEGDFQEVEEGEDEGQMEVDFVLGEEAPLEEEEEPHDKYVTEEQSDEEAEEDEMTANITEDVTENYRLAKTPHLATPKTGQRSTIQPLTDILKRKNSALPLRSVNEVLKDRGNATPGKPKETKEKEVKVTQRRGTRKSQPSAPIPVSVIKKVFSHYCKMKVSSDVLPGLINVTEKFFKQVPADLEAYCHHAGRKTIDETDVELLMMRQRLINDKKSLNVLIEENLPLEYRSQLIPIARSGNIVYPK